MCGVLYCLFCHLTLVSFHSELKTKKLPLPYRHLVVSGSEAQACPKPPLFYRLLILSEFWGNYLFFMLDLDLKDFQTGYIQ